MPYFERTLRYLTQAACRLLETFATVRAIHLSGSAHPILSFNHAPWSFRPTTLRLSPLRCLCPAFALNPRRCEDMHESSSVVQQPRTISDTCSDARGASLLNSEVPQGSRRKRVREAGGPRLRISSVTSDGNVARPGIRN